MVQPARLLLLRRWLWLQLRQDPINVSLALSFAAPAGCPLKWPPSGCSVTAALTKYARGGTPKTPELGRLHLGLK